ncbi:hypothetical protein ANN_18611 [Periplaneta americana]|uniref:Uncharacterized protein n=1 Tax=Periplaneta americana TaxID=6978 RepID=A0ABQ8SP87_PERAM|nr:hypothetical protein ANN_18611 [Periplaneta americana]
MKSEDFLDVASKADRALNTLTLRITQVSWIRVACDHPTLVLTRNNLSDSEQWKTCQVLRKRRTLQSITDLEKFAMLTPKNSLKAEKKDLLAILDFMDTKYHGFYTDLCQNYDIEVSGFNGGILFVSKTSRTSSRFTQTPSNYRVFPRGKGSRSMVLTTPLHSTVSSWKHGASSAEEAGTAEFVKSEPAVVSLISVSSGRSVSSSGANSSSTNTLWLYGQIAEPVIGRFYFFKCMEPHSFSPLPFLPSHPFLFISGCLTWFSDRACDGPLKLLKLSADLHGYVHSVKQYIKQLQKKNNHQQELDINISQQRRKLLKDIPPEPRRLAVASFRLNAEHDILGKHLNRLDTLPSASCILCNQQEDMDRQNLAKCPALKPSKEVDRYWETRARIGEGVYLEHYFQSYGLRRQNGSSLLHIKEQYEERFNESPNNRTMLAAIDKFRHTGSVLYQRKRATGRSGIVTTNENHGRLLQQVLQSPKRSLRRRCLKLGLSDRSVRRMFKELGGFTYRIQVAQHLTERDERTRLQYCSRVLSMRYQDPDFFCNMWFSNESHIHLVG